MRAPKVVDFYTAAWPDFTPALTMALSKRLVNPPCRGSILGDSVHYRVMDIIGVFCGEASPASNVE